jgi:hypothetical protein
MIGCAKPEPVQDPLDYLRIGVDPGQEAIAVIEDLRRHGYTIGRRLEEPGYVAFDAANGLDSTVRVVTTRGPSLSLHVPDVRWPERQWVELAPNPRPDFDRDGRHDVVVAIRERERTCLAWVQVNLDGFVAEVFRSNREWGDSPCVIEVDPNWPRLLLEVSVPDAMSPDARVRVPVRATARSWTLDDSPSAIVHWDRQIERRKQALEEATKRGDVLSSDRLSSELDWLEQLRKAKEPVLEPAGDGEEAR